jgi:ATP synthase protein I
MRIYIDKVLTRQTNPAILESDIFMTGAGDMSRKDNNGRNDLAKAFRFFTQIGINIVVCVGAGIFLGNWLDGLLNTSPWLLLLFSFIGAGAAFKSIVDMGKK